MTAIVDNMVTTEFIDFHGKLVGVQRIPTLPPFGHRQTNLGLHTFLTNNNYLYMVLKWGGADLG